MCFTKEKRCYCPKCSKTIAKTVTDLVCPSNDPCPTRNIRPLPMKKKEVASDEPCRDCANVPGYGSPSGRSSSTAARPSDNGGGGRYLSPPGMSSSNRVQTLNSDYQPRQSQSQSHSSSSSSRHQERSQSNRQAGGYAGEYRSVSSRRADAGGAEGSARFNGSSRNGGGGGAAAAAATTSVSRSGGSSVDVGFERRPAFDLIERRPGGNYVATSGSGSGSSSSTARQTGASSSSSRHGGENRGGYELVKREQPCEYASASAVPGSSSSSSSTARQQREYASSSSVMSGPTSTSTSTARHGGDCYGQLVERRPTEYSSRSRSSGSQASSTTVRQDGRQAGGSSSLRYEYGGDRDRHLYSSSRASKNEVGNVGGVSISGSVTITTSRTVEVSVTYDY